jgi:hypothetical protein
LAAAFVTKILYETFRLVVVDTSMDVRLSLNTQASLSAEAGVSAELWSDPFLALNSNVFWGGFEQVDVLFGGQKPFGKEEHGSEEVLARHGGFLSAFFIGVSNGRWNNAHSAQNNFGQGGNEPSHYRAVVGRCRG